VKVRSYFNSPVYDLASLCRGVKPHVLMYAKKSGGGFSKHRLKLDLLVPAVLGEPGSGALSAALVRVCRVEVIALPDNVHTIESNINHMFHVWPLQGCLELCLQARVAC